MQNFAEELKDEIDAKLNNEEMNYEIQEYSADRHIVDLLKDIVHGNLDKDLCLEHFEELSIKRKMSISKRPFQFTHHKEQPTYVPDLSECEEDLFKNLNKKKHKTLTKVENYMDDIVQQSRLLQWAGISFNNLEWYKIKLSLQKLLQLNDAVNMRFWGKIFGKQADYYIIQGTLKTYPDTLPKQNVEQSGIEGLNHYSFWVSNDCLDTWFELPDVNQDMLKAAKLFKYQLSGDYYSKVNAFNIFPWTEIYLLKCQILRIMHGSSIVPVDSQRMKREENPVLEEKTTEYNDEFVVPAFEEMNNMEKWIHEYANILNCGRLIHSQPVSDEMLEKDKYIQRMSLIAVDEPLQPEKPGWNFKIVGDNQTYNQAPPKEGTTNYAALVIKNLRWPGATTVFKNSEWVNIYIGDGIKYGGHIFIPVQPGDVENDPEGLEEFPEPNPDKEPIIIEEDTDEEKEENAGD